ncbi:MAG: electron transport complex subunit RsxG [Gammaproteobacteria bacterium]|nr:electron transport complex subunit RsxG [Gammaproteobacteria bacterium]
MTNKSSVEISAVEKSGVLNGLQKGLILGAFALLSIGLTVITWQLTKERIQSEKEKALLMAISDLIPTEHFANDPYRDCTLIKDQQFLGSEESQSAWRLRDADNNPVGVVISSVAPDGYNGKISLIVGHFLGPEGETNSTKLAGVRVTEHNETPGLGDKIDAAKSNWILQFAGSPTHKIIPDDWQVKKDGGGFDAFTGATITPRAVLSAIQKNTQFFKANSEQLFSAPSNCQKDESEQHQGETNND